MAYVVLSGRTRRILASEEGLSRGTHSDRLVWASSDEPYAVEKSGRRRFLGVRMRVPAAESAQAPLDP